jgi:ketosteroid isomerase-like protein
MTAEVLDAFEGFYRPLCEDRDAEGALALWADDDDITVFGSEASDRSVGPAEVRTHLEAIAAYPSRLAFRWDDPRVRIEGDVAWVNASGTFSLDGAETAYQVTGVFVRRDGRWLWHTHSGSTPS